MFVTKQIRRFRDCIGRHFHELVHIRDTPHAISGGVAIGIFYGFVPLFIPFVPIKTAFSFLTSWLFRCSKTAALIAVTAHDAIFPVWPLVLRWEYDIGFWLLHHRMPSKLHFQSRNVRFEQWFSMDTYHSWSQWVHERLSWVFLEKVLVPTLLGSVVIGIPCAVVCYFIAIRIVRRYQAAVLHKLEAEATADPDAPEK